MPPNKKNKHGHLLIPAMASGAVSRQPAHQVAFHRPINGAALGPVGGLTASLPEQDGREARAHCPVSSLRAHAWPMRPSIITLPAELASSPCPSCHPLPLGGLPVGLSLFLQCLPRMFFPTPTDFKLLQEAFPDHSYYMGLSLLWIPSALRVMAQG